LRGLVVLGGQAKIDTNLLLDAAASASSTHDFMGGGEQIINQYSFLFDLSMHYFFNQC
jgi:hypothetical protein